MKIRLLQKLVWMLLIAALPTSAQATRRGMMLATGSTEAALDSVRVLADLGATIVRFPIYFSFEPSVDVWLNRADAVLAECERRNVTLVIDFHSTVTDVNDFVNRWRLFAARFKNRQSFWYDLCNEPKHPQWRDVALRAARAIRSIDARHYIIYSPPGVTTSSALRVEPLPGITRQILQFHFYDWIHDVQGHPMPTERGDSLDNYRPYPSTNRTVDHLRNLIARVRDARDRTGCPVYIGEVAIPRFHPNAARFLRDFTTICDDMEITLTIHAFREADVWNYELNPNAWLQITRWLAR